MRIETPIRKATRKVGAIASIVANATAVTLYTPTTGRTFMIRKIHIFNNNGAATIVQIGTGLAGAYAQQLPGDYVVNGQTDRVVEDDILEFEFTVAATVQASVAAAAPNNVQVMVEVDEIQGPSA